MDWNTGLGTLDPTHFAAHVTLTYSGYDSYVIDDGVNSGETRVLAGALTGVTYSDAAGNTLLDLSNLSVRLPVFMAALARGDSFGTWQMLNHAATTTITGSGSAAGPGHATSGDVIETTTGNDTVMALGGDDFVQDRGGADAYYGGSGFDTLSYEGWNFSPWAFGTGISVNQLLGTVRGPDGQIDTISGFEDISGTMFGDAMRGNNMANRFEGGAGADYFDGCGGRDTVSYASDAGWGGTDGIRVNLATGSLPTALALSAGFTTSRSSSARPRGIRSLTTVPTIPLTAALATTRCTSPRAMTWVMAGRRPTALSLTVLSATILWMIFHWPRATASGSAVPPSSATCN